MQPHTTGSGGWYYSEMGGIHANYDAAAFYDADGKLKPEFRVHLQLYEEFVSDLKRLSAQGGELRHELEALRAKM